MAGSVKLMKRDKVLQRPDLAEEFKPEMTELLAHI